MYPSTAAFLVCSGGASLCIAIAVLPQFHAERIGVLAQAFWLCGGCFLGFLNAIVWRKDTVIRALILCDISIYFYEGTKFGVICTTLCILRRLNISLTGPLLGPLSNLQKAQAVVTDTTISICIPIFFMGMYYVNAEHRANIYEGFGCFTAARVTVVYITTMYVAPLILTLISAMYGVRNFLLIRRIYRNTREMHYFDESARSRFVRVMAFSCIDIFVTIPLLLCMFISDSVLAIKPWVSWDDMKREFSVIEVKPSIIWRNDPALKLRIHGSKCFTVGVAFIWIIFFGYTSDTRRVYGPWLQCLGRSPASDRPSYAADGDDTSRQNAPR